MTVSIDPKTLAPEEAYKLVIGSVVPRPIAWVTSRNAKGAVNLAPFSAFMFVSPKPPLMAISVGHKAGVYKDTATNILQREDYVIHIANMAMIEPLHLSSIEHPPDVSEVEELGLATVPSSLVATPRLKEMDSPIGKARIGLLGVQAGGKPEDWRTETYGIVDSLRLAGQETWFIVRQTAGYLGGLAIGKESPDQLSGPAGLAQVSGEMAKLGVNALLNLVAILSISIGLLNLAPVPLLDGGHLLFYVIEAIRGRALNERAQEIGFRIGIAVVGGLMVLATYNDIARLGPPILKWILRG